MFSFDGKQYDNRPAPQGVFNYYLVNTARSENLQARVNDDHDMASVEMIRIFLIILLAWCKAQAGVGLSN